MSSSPASTAGSCARPAGGTGPGVTTASLAGIDVPELDEYLHLYLANRGVLIMPFHNVALMCPATQAVDVGSHVAVCGGSR